MPPRAKLIRRELLRTIGYGPLLTGVSGVATACRHAEVPPTSEAAFAERVDVSAVRLGLDTHTVHRSLTAKDPALRRSLEERLEELVSLELDGLQIDPSHFPGDDAARLDRLERLADARGLYIEFGMSGCDVARLTRRGALTAGFGGKAVRTFCGDQSTSREELENYVIESARTRKRPAAEIEIGHRSTVPGLLMNIAWRAGRTVRWDAAREEIPGDEAANRLVTNAYRAPWRLPAR